MPVNRVLTVPQVPLEISKMRALQLMQESEEGEGNKQYLKDFMLVSI